MRERCAGLQDIKKKKKHHAKIKPLVRQSSALRQPTVEELADMVKGS